MHLKYDQHLMHLMEIKRLALHDASSSLATWKNLSAPSSIKHKGLNGDNSYPNVSFELLIKDEEADQTTAPKFTYLYPCSSTKKAFSNVLRNQIF